MHLNHLLRKFGNNLIHQNLVAADVQDYIDTRGKYLERFRRDYPSDLLRTSVILRSST